MWNEFAAKWPRRWRLYVVLALFPVLSFVPILWSFSPRLSSWLHDEPLEGFYWSAAQYQIAFGKLREQLLIAAAAGSALEPVDSAELVMRGEVLLSKGRLLTEPSMSRSRLQAIPGFEDSATQIARFDQKLTEILHRPDLSAVDAKEALNEFDALDATVVGLANAARQRELDGRSSVFEAVKQDEHDGLIQALVVWAVCMGWLAWILLAHRRKQQLAHERLRALEAERLAREQLNQAMKTKAQFLSMVSHELRSPLQAIVSSVDVLNLQIPPSERLSAIQRIRRSALMLGVQLRDLLTIARGEAGRLEISPESFEAGALIEDVADVAAHAAHEKGLQFHTQVPDEPVFARADVQRISQVLANLVSNAVRYTRAGQVSLSLEAPMEQDGRIVFVVSDTGSGLPEGAVARLTTPRTSDDELRPRQDGSGVGLMIVRTVVEHLGGTIEVAVTPGAGTRITVGIPVAFEDPDAVPNDATADGLVLVVEDQAVISASVVALVKGLGHPCHVADSGSAAVKLLSEHAYETAFIDLDLPEIGGVALARRVRSNPGPNQHAYLVAITATRPEIEEDPFDQVLVKPVEGLRVQWHLAHRSRTRKEGKAAAPASRPVTP
ncbi:hybrid sensor histidine kinase/response regulator [Variovorax guangxiensis]|uniref:hybrid sensor histidine kinase/response regulator n=1 Tax=Variovorax guangxiensis TaxID=1775474 RepID=UPI002869F6B9|nr:hybrid sensor histidine kinase/response regulator [Variovorax guangxiensis]